MKKNDLADLTVDELLASYTKNAQEYGEMVDIEKIKAGNRRMDALIQISNEFWNRDAEAQTRFANLFTHVNRDVRWVAACHGASRFPDAARRVLENEALAQPDWRSHFIKSKLRSM